jgi:hypothetical protein
MTLDVDKPGDRPATKPTDEIEITDEMIRRAYSAAQTYYAGDGYYDVSDAYFRTVLAGAIGARATIKSKSSNVA